MNYDVVIARYGEIGLKSSKVRARFERKLVKNIKALLTVKLTETREEYISFQKTMASVWKI